MGEAQEAWNPRASRKLPEVAGSCWKLLEAGSLLSWPSCTHCRKGCNLFIMKRFLKYRGEEAICKGKEHNSNTLALSEVWLCHEAISRDGEPAAPAHLLIWRDLSCGRTFGGEAARRQAGEDRAGRHRTPGKKGHKTWGWTGLQSRAGSAGPRLPHL